LIGEGGKAMIKLKWMGLVLLFIFIVPFPVSAGDFDGSKPLLCAVTKVFECAPGGGCAEVPPESIDIPRFFKIDFKKKRISAIRPGGTKRTTSIKNLEHIDGKLVLQGAEDGREGVRDGLGWTIAIMEDTGQMTLTASGDEVGFVIFGASIPQ